VVCRIPVREVILTGGDPLLLSPRGWLDHHRLSAMPHLDTLRITRGCNHDRPHRRRADDGAGNRSLAVARAACEPRARVHREAKCALARLRRAGLPLLGQSVLLRGVNDSAEVLEALFRAMVRWGQAVLPASIDAAPGTARFHVPSRRAAPAGGLAGGHRLAWPTYVLDIGRPRKCRSSGFPAAGWFRARSYRARHQIGEA